MDGGMLDIPTSAPTPAIYRLERVTPEVGGEGGSQPAPGYSELGVSKEML